MRLNTIIVEDEPLSQAFLNNLLVEFCPEVQVVGTAPAEEQAVDMIKSLLPDLVFLDIELQQGTGFEVLKKTFHHKYQVIFTTAFDHYGIKAIRFSGVDFLQKPIDIDGLQSAVASIIAKQQKDAGEIAVKHLLHTLDNNNVPEQLLIQTGNGGMYIPVDSIIYIESSGTECIFNNVDGKIVSTGCGIKEFEQMLGDLRFFRLHHSYIINLGKIMPSSKPETGFIMMSNNTPVPVSSKKVQELKNILTANPLLR